MSWISELLYSIHAYIDTHLQKTLIIYLDKIKTK